MGEPEGLTAWTGSALDCPSSSNIIILFHSRFMSVYKTCNNGAIVARGLSVEGNNYISQLNVTLTSDTAGKTITCLYDNINTFMSFMYHLSTTIPTTGLSQCTCTCIVSQSHVII